MARYVDADKAEERFKYIYCDDCDSRNGIKCRACGLRDGADVFSDTPTEDVQPVVHDDKWSEFRSFMYNLHEMQNEGCRGCEEPPTTCRKCMQDYYWLNIKYYL